MTTITILNLILVLYLIGKDTLKRYSIEVQRTFWQKKPYGIVLIKWQYPVGTLPNSGTHIFRYFWRKAPEDKPLKRKRPTL